MISFGDVGFISKWFVSIENCIQKRGELLSVITSEKNFINLHLAAFVTVFAHHLVHAYKFCIIQKSIFQIFLQ